MIVILESKFLNSLMGLIHRYLRRENHFRFGYPDSLRLGSSLLGLRVL